jgi:hypothetical protein
MSTCKKLTTKKYMNRSSPPYPANKCQGKLKPGNDGVMYESVSNKNGVHRWVMAGHKSRRVSRRKSPRKSGLKSRRVSRRKSPRKSGRKSRRVSRRKSPRKSGRKYKCTLAKKNTKEDLSKELKCHVRNWGRITGRDQDLSNERIKQESFAGIKGHLKFYRKNNPYGI